MSLGYVVTIAITQPSVIQSSHQAVLSQTTPNVCLERQLPGSSQREGEQSKEEEANYDKERKQ